MSHSSPMGRLGKAFPNRMLEPICSKRQGLAGLFSRSSLWTEYGKETSQTTFSSPILRRSDRPRSLAPERSNRAPSRTGGERDASQQEPRDDQRRGPPGRG